MKGPTWTPLALNEPCLGGPSTTYRLNRRGTYFLGRRYEVVDFRSSQSTERPSALQTERQRLALPKIKWEGMSVSNKHWFSTEHSEHQKSFSLIKSLHTSQPPSQTVVMWSGPSVCGEEHAELLHGGGSRCWPEAMLLR